ncbi:fibronectin type III domain-containing protein [Massilia forsythiae]|uniref:Fibronectin type III domain-containing protein n=1 Tax=Massilia forsythiae TaxID=2728020 RepID=A0A7Z2W195_9BURK|nr:fibronectin type III domain-containing protein [Massilia forsythiae]QJE03051.1 fibronectin type III domain-containing protein [Massilia forsythiae]
MTGFSAVGMTAVGGPRSTSTQASTPVPTDTTAPTLSGSLVISAITAGGAHAAWPAASDDTGVAGYEFSCDTGTPAWVDVGSVLSLDISGKSASTAYTARVRAYDAAGNRSSALTAPLTTNAALDTAAPTMSGAITLTSITSSGAHAAWPEAADNVAVAGYEFSCDTGVPSWVDVGAARVADPSGLSPATNYTARVRSYDAAGNRSAPLTAPLTTAPATQPPAGSVDVTKVPMARIVVFEGGARVVAFAGGTRIVRF